VVDGIVVKDSGDRNVMKVIDRSKHSMMIREFMRACRGGGRGRVAGWLVSFNLDVCSPFDWDVVDIRVGRKMLVSDGQVSE
jgi:hypothetical protein